MSDRWSGEGPRISAQTIFPSPKFSPPKGISLPKISMAWLTNNVYHIVPNRGTVHEGRTLGQPLYCVMQGWPTVYSTVMNCRRRVTNTINQPICTSVHADMGRNSQCFFQAKSGGACD